MQVHIHILKKTDLIMVHRRIRQDGNQEILRNVTVHSLGGIDMSQESTLAKFDEDIQITHKGKHIKVIII